jgi:hypothetical protein
MVNKKAASLNWQLKCIRRVVFSSRRGEGILAKLAALSPAALAAATIDKVKLLS